MDWSFGLTMMFMGMGVTLVTLLLLALIIKIMIRLFPIKKEVEAAEETK